MLNKCTNLKLNLCRVLKLCTCTVFFIALCIPTNAQDTPVMSNKLEVTDLSKNDIFLKSQQELIQSLSSENAKKEAEINTLIAKQGNQHIKNNIFLIGLLSTFALLFLSLLYIYNQIKTRKVFLIEDIKNKALLSKQSQELQEVSEQKINLLANIAHELQTPLSIIGGLSNHLSNLITDKAQLKFLGIIFKNSQSIVERSAQILELARVKKLDYNLNLDLFYLNELIQLSINDLQFNAQTKNLQIIFEEEPEGNLISSDVTRLKVIIKNILVNAIRYSNNGNKIIVQVGNSNNIFTIKIQDFGNGIPEKEISKIFERYYQSSNSSLARGFGIGLSICKDYVELLGGKLSVQSQVNSYTIFDISGPNKKADIDINNREIRRLLINPASKIKLSESSERNSILIVDDSFDYYTYLNSFLESNFDTIYAQNGNDALDLLAKKTPDLILTDWMMPEKNGLQFVKVVKEHPNFKEIPIIMVSARNLVTDEIKALKNGATVFLSKPIDADKLMLQISSLLTQDEAVLGQQNLSTNYFSQDKQDVSIREEDQDWIYELEKITLPLISDFDLNLTIIAELMGVGLAQLNKKVKEITGLTTMRFIKELRYWEARRMLEEKEASSVKMVGLSVGFKDVKNFSRNFKKRFDKYPNEYL